MTRRYVWMAAAAVGALAAAGACQRRAAEVTANFSDEPPIFVLNGSLDIHSGDPTDSTHWTWTEDGGKTEFKHDPKTGGTSGPKDDLYVQVVSTQASCSEPLPASGKKVEVVYTYDSTSSPKTFTASFSRRADGSQMFTRLTPHKGFTLDANGWTIKYGTPSTTDYITELRVVGGGKPTTCTFKNYEKDLAIHICADSGQKPCQ